MTVTTEHRPAETHKHTHGPGCGHEAVIHHDPSITSMTVTSTTSMTVIMTSAPPANVGTAMIRARTATARTAPVPPVSTLPEHISRTESAEPLTGGLARYRKVVVTA